MSVEMCANWYMEVKDRVRALREALSLTQTALAERAGLQGQAYIGKIESGANKASSHKLRASLAKGFGLPREALDAFLDGKIDVAEATRRAQPSLALVPEMTREPDPQPVIDPHETESPLEAALNAAFEKGRHTLKDAQAVQAVLRANFQQQHTEGDLVEGARVWLDAAAQLRKEGVPVTTQELLFRVSVHRKPQAMDRAEADAADEETLARQKAEAAARGEVWGSHSHMLERGRGKKPGPKS